QRRHLLLPAGPLTLRSNRGRPSGSPHDIHLRHICSRARRLLHRMGSAPLRSLGVHAGQGPVMALPLSAKQAWGLLAAGVLAYEVACKEGELLSEGVDDWVTAKPVLTRGVIAML